MPFSLGRFLHLTKVHKGRNLILKELSPRTYLSSDFDEFQLMGESTEIEDTTSSTEDNVEEITEIKHTATSEESAHPFMSSVHKICCDAAIPNFRQK